MKKKLLYEVSIIRPLVIFLLIVYHAVCIYGGVWTPVNNVQIPLYDLLMRIISGFRIETIALVAGYVYSYQFLDLNRRFELKSFVIKKIKRLIIPCLFFGILYYFIILYDSSNFSFWRFVYELTNGVGHLWFLPMLFWCFLGIWVLTHKKFNEKITIIVLFFISLIPRLYLPFGLSLVPHFMFFFYAGFLLYKYKSFVISILNKKKYIVLLALSYFIFLYTQIFLASWYASSTWDEIFILKLIYKVILNLIKDITISSGILVLWLIVCRWISKPSYKISERTIWYSSICYGVYVYHQFILKYLYYKTSLPEVVGAYWLPWLAILITLLVSLLFTHYTLKTKIGRYLIG